MVCKRAFTLWMEGRGDERCYGVSSGGGTNVRYQGWTIWSLSSAAELMSSLTDRRSL